MPPNSGKGLPIVLHPLSGRPRVEHCQSARSAKGRYKRNRHRRHICEVLRSLLRSLSPSPAFRVMPHEIQHPGRLLEAKSSGGGDLGDTLAILLGLTILFVGICAGLGWYSRRRG